MVNTHRIGFFAAAAAVIAFTGVSTENATAQLNEKRIERKATGRYTGDLLNSREQEKIDGHSPGPFTPIAGGHGGVRVPVKDGKLKSTAKDTEIPGNNAAKFVGQEKRSDIRRNGRKINVKAEGSMDVLGIPDKKTKGKVVGKIVKRGGKHVADVRFSGERRNTHGGGSTCYKTRAKGKK